jgi:hypothetical protein
MERKVLRKLNNFVKNEINASKQLKEHEKYFILLKNIKEINLLKINEKFKVKEKEQLAEYKIFYFRDKQNKNFKTYFKEIKNEKEKMYFVIKSFEKLLESLKIMDNLNYCHQSINKENISIDFISNYPKLSNFQYFKSFKDLSENDLYNDEIPEIKIINFIKSKKLNTISYENIEEFEDEKEKKFLELLINKPKEKIVNELKKYERTWDLFCLSKVFASEVEDIIKENHLENSFFNKFEKLLRKNCSVDGSLRNSVEETKNEFAKLLEESENEWKMKINNV